MQEIIYVCKSINNKNVREGELKILRKSNKDSLCFEFGENEMFLKKRFYNNETDFENDFKKLQELKEKYENNPVPKKSQDKEDKSNDINNKTSNNEMKDNKIVDDNMNNNNIINDNIIDNILDKKIKK